MVSTSTEHPHTANPSSPAPQRTARARSAVELAPVPTVGAGLTLFSRAAGAVLDRPIAAIAWALAIALVIPLGLVWGAPFALIGWLGARPRLREEGLAGLGEVLAPTLARAQFGDGLAKGLWRTRTLGLAIAAVQLPTLVIALVPAAAAFVLLRPAGAVLPGATGPVVMFGLPAVIGAIAMIFAALELLLVLRIVSESGARRLSLGLVFEATGRAWRAVLDETRTVTGVGLALLASAIGAGAVVGASGGLAGALELGAGRELVLTWTGALAGSIQLAIAMECVASWVERARVAPIAQGERFSASAQLASWLGAAGRWLAEKGLVAIGLFICIIVGVVAISAEIARGEGVTSWVGLGWFAVTAASLLVLRSSGEARVIRGVSAILIGLGSAWLLAGAGAVVAGGGLGRDEPELHAAETENGPRAEAMRLAEEADAEIAAAEAAVGAATARGHTRVAEAEARIDTAEHALDAASSRHKRAIAEAAAERADADVIGNVRAKQRAEATLAKLEKQQQQALKKPMAALLAAQADLTAVTDREEAAVQEARQGVARAKENKTRRADEAAAAIATRVVAAEPKPKRAPVRGLMGAALGLMLVGAGATALARGRRSAFVSLDREERSRRVAPPPPPRMSEPVSEMAAGATLRLSARTLTLDGNVVAEAPDPASASVINESERTLRDPALLSDVMEVVAAQDALPRVSTSRTRTPRRVSPLRQPRAVEAVDLVAAPVEAIAAPVEPVAAPVEAVVAPVEPVAATIAEAARSPTPLPVVAMEAAPESAAPEQAAAVPASEAPVEAAPASVVEPVTEVPPAIALVESAVVLIETAAEPSAPAAEAAPAIDLRGLEPPDAAADKLPVMPSSLHLDWVAELASAASPAAPEDPATPDPTIAVGPRLIQMDEANDEDDKEGPADPIANLLDLLGPAADSCATEIATARSLVFKN